LPFYIQNKVPPYGTVCQTFCNTSLFTIKVLQRFYAFGTDISATNEKELAVYAIITLSYAGKQAFLPDLIAARRAGTTSLLRIKYRYG